MVRRVEVAIIGAGQAGLAALAEVRKTTRDFVLIDRGGLGNTYARIGPLPSKLSAHLAKFVVQGSSLDICGSAGSGPQPRGRVRDPEPTQSARDSDTDPLSAQCPELPAAALIRGEARFIGPNTLRAGGQTIKARSIVIATGAASDVPSDWKERLGNRILTVETLFKQRQLPGSIAVVGLGPVGLELGQVLYRLGVQVIGIESSQCIARLQDPFVNQLAMEHLRCEFPLWCGAPAQVEPHGDAVLVRAGARQAVVDRVLVAVGRRPDLERLCLIQAGCALDDRGLPIHHPGHLRLGRRRIFIAGDAAGGNGGLRQVAEQGRVAGYNACHSTPIRFAAMVPLTVIDSEPTIAWVGSAWSQLDPSQVVTGQMDFGPSDPAKPLRQGWGLVRVYANRRNGRILGGAMIGPGCEHLALVLARGIEQRLTVQQMAQLPCKQPAIDGGRQETLKRLLTDLVRRIDPVLVKAPAPPWLIHRPGRFARAVVTAIGECIGAGLGQCYGSVNPGLGGNCWRRQAESSTGPS